MMSITLQTITSIMWLNVVYFYLMTSILLVMIISVLMGGAIAEKEGMKAVYLAAGIMSIGLLLSIWAGY